MNQIAQQIFQGILDGEQDVVATKVIEALQAAIPPKTILDEGLLGAIRGWLPFRTRRILCA